MDEITNFYTRDPLAGGKAEQLVIFLHGLGADGKDLMGLAPYFAEVLPNAAFVSPDAPFPCDMAPMGYQWFSVQDWTQEAFLFGVEKAAPLLDNFITEQIEAHGVTPEKTALVGFSQGTMMSLYTAPCYPERLAGVLGYSGALVWDGPVNGANLHKIPVHLIHGDADPVVDISRYYDAKERLSAGGFTVTGGVTEGLMHGIDEAGIDSGTEFLKRILLAE